VAEAREMSAAEMSAPLGALPPMKIHCGQMVEGALRAALDAEVCGAVAPVATESRAAGPGRVGNLAESLGEASGLAPARVKIVKMTP
jgi:nitrogen fixation protein NifU and related proteins